jgi:hypothetical protein
VQKRVQHLVLPNLRFRLLERTNCHSRIIRMR